MIVVDASVAVEILLRTSRGERAISDVMHAERHAPHIIDLEFASTLRRLHRREGFDRSRAELAIESMRAWRLERHEHKALLARVWDLRNSISAYDASYVALAEMLNAPLLTYDARLSRSHGHNAKIVLLS